MVFTLEYYPINQYFQRYVTDQLDFEIRIKGGQV